MRIAVNEIKIAPGRRQVNPNGVEELTKSISTVGLLNPITIDQDHVLVAGLHRLEAVKRLGWTEIECSIVEFDDLQAELAEINENVVRTSLTTLEFGELLERRKEIYESLHPETKAGQAQAAGMNRAIGNHVSEKTAPTKKSFAKDTADKLGKSVRSVELTIQMMKGLTLETREIFRMNPKYELSQDKALKLSRLDPETQKTVALLMVYNGLKRVEDYPPASVQLGGKPRAKTDQKCMETIARLKDPTKETARFTPELFVANYEADVRHFLRQVASLRENPTVEVVPELTGEHIEELEKLTDSCHEALLDFIQWLKRGRNHV